MNSSTPEKKPKLDEHIGYAKFKKTKTYIVRVDYEVTAKNIKHGEKLIDKKASILDIQLSDGFGDNSTESIEIDCYSIDAENEDDGKIEKIAECIPETYKDDNDKEQEDYECGQWVNDDFEYKKNEDGTDITEIVEKYI
jgi:hypothetical protein